MKLKASIMTCVVAGSVFLPSCAYMQTHKNIEESFRTHQGYTLQPELKLYKAGQKYYLAVGEQELRKHYPVIHDSVFMKQSNAPTYEIVSGGSQKMYREISAGTAQVLQRNDGYAELQTLSDELMQAGTPWLRQLPAGAAPCRIAAEIQGSEVTTSTGTVTETSPAAATILSTIDQVCIDWPGTVLYNVAIPVMAPFVFFYEFLNEQ